ncbi:MAG: beta-ketoacyl-ACP reductase [Trueperaceae bacterium]|nr:MAG: beta-ketoacyl-ACP reductase [Trueperaceae bacterium]
MTQQLGSRVALVTGAARGIGAATALRLAEEGAHICLCDLEEEGVQQVAAEIRKLGVEALPLRCDVTDKGEVEVMIGKIIDRFGRLDILINNAGVIRDNLLFKMSDEDWDAVMNVHLKGAFLCSRAAQKQMVAQQFGKIVNLSSTSAAGRRGQANYAAAKAGIQGFTRTLALELGPFNINVNAVAPGFIDTEMTRSVAERLGYDPDEFKRSRAEQIALRRIGQPRDVANVVCFLCSEDSSYLSGQVLYVSGGPGPLG